MRKSNLMKVVSILVISVMVVLFATTVFAADANGYDDLTSTLTQNGTNNNTGNTGNTANTPSNNALSTNTPANNTNNTANLYNSTNLPKTGIGDSSIPVAMLVVIFGISAVYAYKKISDYKNI